MYPRRRQHAVFLPASPQDGSPRILNTCFAIYLGMIHMIMCMNGHKSKLEVCLLSLQVQGPELAACNVCSKVWFSDSYTKHLLFHIKWSNQAGIVKRWVTINP
ncbi:hypothetical protein GB937_000155 [Aspergillus fischeri]|nr:hypothetical protein GB937_000155 [Aspergillus fischeri]